MPTQTSSYVGDAAIKRLFARYHCPTLFHVARMRLWGTIASPVPSVSPVETFASLWPGDTPPLGNADDANAFFQAMMGFWNELAGLQDGSPPLKLHAIGKIDSREGLHAAAKLRVEELFDGFLEGFTGGRAEIDVPPGVSACVRGVEQAIELIAGCRNTFAAPPGPDDAAMLAEFVRTFPVIDSAVEADLNAIAVAVKRWRGNRLRAPRPKRRKRSTLN